MKLSMWMIANRLSPLMDISVNIRQDAKPILNSARVAYSTNTAHVYQSGNNVIVEGEGDQILLYDIKLKEAFEIIQGVFDYYQDWEAEVEAAVAQGDYQHVIDCCWLVFSNPMMLMDGNNRLLAITRSPELGEMDPEWDYLCKYGYSSLNSIRAMRYDYSNIDFSHSGSQSFRFHNSGIMQYGGVSYTMIFNEAMCGRITLLEKGRRINAGDTQLLERMAKLLEPRLGAAVTVMPNPHTNVFFKLLASQPYGEKELAVQLAYYQWLPEDPYQLCTILPADDTNEISLHILRRTVALNLQNAIVLEKGGRIHVLCNRDMYNDPSHRQFREILLANNPLRIAYSLCVPNISCLPLLEKQTDFMLRSEKTAASGAYAFEDFGLSFLLTDHSPREVVVACHPVVTTLWHKARNGNSDLYDTLREYIDCERSLSRTAAALFTHRNTVLYRIRKCQDMLGSDLDSAEKRLYIRISMQTLELYGAENDKKAAESP